MAKGLAISDDLPWRDVIADINENAPLAEGRLMVRELGLTIYSGVSCVQRDSHISLGSHIWPKEVKIMMVEARL